MFISHVPLQILDHISESEIPPKETDTQKSIKIRVCLFSAEGSRLRCKQSGHGYMKGQKLQGTRNSPK